MSDLGLTHGVSADTAAMMRYDANKRSVLVAYLLWFFLGYVGAHRFYLRRIGSAVAMLILVILSGVLLGLALAFYTPTHNPAGRVLLGITGVSLVAMGIWHLVDAFLVPGMARSHNNHLVGQISLQGDASRLR